MKKIVALLLVLGMASIANATVIQLATDPTNGTATQTTHAATLADPMLIGETMMLQLVLNDNDFFTTNMPGYPQYFGYDGYSLLSFDVDIVTNSYGELSRKSSLFADRIRFSGSPATSGIGDEGPGSKLDGIYAVYGENGLNGAGGYNRVVYNFKVEALAAGIIQVGLVGNRSPGGDNPNGYAEYSLQYKELADAFGLPAYGVIAMEDSMMGGLDLYVIPEPMTIALLGLGGLGLLYRRRRA
ncbi:MAG: hypothetical protein AMJ79_08615 [Phycisphaerae bacterium SM23_30]|nr:MAG: hypothetical protein AMJ79_08615 [Phycisphaerae bacterium SM23_30]